MNNLHNKILAELENIDEIFTALPSKIKLPYLTTLELAGVAALIHNFYNGIENILKQILISKNIELPDGKSWHRDIIDTAVKLNIISEECKLDISQYLAFRHFFSHAYALDLYYEKMEPLVEKMQDAFTLLKKDISKYL